MSWRWPLSPRRTMAALIGALLLLACLWPSGRDPQRLASFLFAFLFFTGLAVGSLALVMVHALTGGAWGDQVRAPLMAAARTLPLQALLAVPLLIGVRALYPWAHAASDDPVLRAERWYLEPSLFVGRTIGCFAVWIILLWLIARNIDDSPRTATSPRIAAAGLVAYALSTLIAATDWVVSLQLHWRSSTFGMLLATSWMLAAAALAIWTRCSAGGETRDQPGAGVLADLGNLALMLLLAWSYLVFMQYLTVWVADLPDEIAWYLPRSLTSWRFVSIFIVVLSFAVPFFILLSRRAKRQRSWLAFVAILLLIGNLAFNLWIVVPTLRRAGFSLRWSDACAVLGMGALWFAVYLQPQLPAGRGATASQPQLDDAIA